MPTLETSFPSKTIKEIKGPNPGSKIQRECCKVSEFTDFLNSITKADNNKENVLISSDINVIVELYKAELIQDSIPAGGVQEARPEDEQDPPDSGQVSAPDKSLAEDKKDEPAIQRADTEFERADDGGSGERAGPDGKAMAVADLSAEPEIRDQAEEEKKEVKPAEGKPAAAADTSVAASAAASAAASDAKKPEEEKKATKEQEKKGEELKEGGQFELYDGGSEEWINIEQFKKDAQLAV